MSILLEKVTTAVREAGKIIRDSVLDAGAIEKKGAQNYVTEIDYKVQRFLVSRLEEILPGSNIIAEESENNRYDIASRPTWVLDPVDGTTNLIHDYRHSAVSLGLYEDGSTTLAIVYNPSMDEMFIAQKGLGAQLNGRPISVSGKDRVENSLIGFGTNPYDRTNAAKTFEITHKVFLQCRDIRRSGAAALDLAYVACGRLDAFYEMTLQPWDYAAGRLLIEEAGGRITDWQGNPLSGTAPLPVLASNGLTHAQMLDFLKP